jgi:hypothetical protein
MESTKVEFAVVEEAIEQANAEQLKQLADLQLVLMGGGCGEVVFA